ncbi:MAG: cytochrome c3 family protein [Bacteroidales bacterium]|nr:cytochrome c3 family protein [Bacteroidales bacterium]
MNNLLLYLFLIIAGGFSFLFSPTGTDNKVNQQECNDCHSDLMAGEYLHPVAVNGCSLCHASTGEEHPGTDESEFKLVADYPQICYKCHDDKNSKEHVHYPVQDGYCASCHSPHSSSNKSLIHSNFSENMCTDCHYLEIEDKVSDHYPAKNGDCQDCHDPHQSDYRGVIKMEPNKLCLDCHSRAIETDNRYIPNIKATLSENNTIHDPIESGECTICHLPHAADYPRLLIGEYPTKQYTEAKVDNFEFCFLCHDSEMITADSTVYATNFRNGTQNLHYLHINGTKGRNCNLCHNAHGAPNKYIIEATVKYGNWDMPVEADFTENGGSCATGCHKKLEYSRVTE